jgi:hypothetical protein
MRKLHFAIVALVCSFVASLPACASPIVWNLSGTVGQDTYIANTAFSGTVTLDFSVPGTPLLAWDIQVAASNSGPVTVDGATFASNGTNSPTVLPAPGNSLYFTSGSYWLSLDFAAPLTAAGGTIAITGGDFYTQIAPVGFPSSFTELGVLSGSISGQPEVDTTPEPGSWLLLASGVLGLGVLRRRTAMRGAGFC